MMTPQEAANCTFTKSMVGGYNMASVDDFLDKLTEDYSALYKENTALKAKLKILADKTEEYREIEDAMRSTLLTAQRMAASIVSEAEQKRDKLIADGTGTAKRRLAELREEMSREESRLEQVRQDVAAQIEAEERRLAVAQGELRHFIQAVQSVCGKQLELLERLPELPAVIPAAPPPPAPAAEPALPEETHVVPEVPEDAVPDETAMERDIQEAVAALSAAPSAEEKEAPAGGDPFEEEPGMFPGEDSLQATRVLNLDELQFGRNYKP